MRRLGLLLGTALAWGCAAPPGPPAMDRARALMEGSSARTGDLRLQCEPADAEVWLDGVPQGTCADYSGRPSGLRVGEGMHRVEVKKEGFWPYVTWLAPSGARAALRVTLQPLKPNEGANP